MMLQWFEKKWYWEWDMPSQIVGGRYAYRLGPFRTEKKAGRIARRDLPVDLFNQGSIVKRSIDDRCIRL